MECNIGKRLTINANFSERNLGGVRTRGPHECKILQRERTNMKTTWIPRVGRVYNTKERNDQIAPRLKESVCGIRMAFDVQRVRLQARQSQ